MNNEILISIITPCYNHEKYIKDFINSLINQSYSNWELIIVDDCSKDNSVEIIKTIKDSRIHLFKQSFNQGPGAALNKAFSESKGDIIVDMASDDMLKNDYFDFIIKKFNENPEIGVIYSTVDAMDDKNKVYDHWTLDIKNNRYEYLKEMFYRFNTFFSPGMAVRRDIYKKIYPMDISMVQHQDYQWHIIFLMNTECFVSEKAYVLYRSEKEKGISLGSHSTAADNRFKLEIFKLMNTFLKITDLKEIKKITGSELCDKLSDDCYKFIWAMAALKCETLEKRQWAYTVLSDVYADENIRKQLYENLGFKFADFLSLAKENYYKSDSFFQKKLKGLKKRLSKFSK